MVWICNIVYYRVNVKYLVTFRFFICDGNFNVANVSSGKSRKIICRILYNGSTRIWFIVCKNFYEIECSTNFCRKVSMRYCRKKMIVWCCSEMEVVVVFRKKMSNLGGIRFQTNMCLRIDYIDV